MNYQQIYMNEQKETGRMALATISNADTPSNKEMSRHLEMVKEDVNGLLLSNRYIRYRFRMAL